jgi:intracellular multiplication protein IcmK
MMKALRLYVVPALVISAMNASFAQPAAQGAATGKQAQSQQQPPSGLGKETTDRSTPPTIVLPKPKDVVEDAVSDIENIQLTDEQIERLKRLSLRKERQKALPYVTAPKMVTRTLPIKLDPGITPDSIRLSMGNQTAIAFSDMMGNPWYIKKVQLNRGLFSDGKEGKEDDTEPTSILSLEPRTAAAFGSVTVILKGLATPIVLTLATGQKESDARVDAKVPGANPDAIDTTTITSMPNIDATLTAFLDGVPPRDARRLRVTGLHGTEAWLFNQNLYLRTDADAQYPAYLAAAKSTSGKAVYRFASRYASVTLLSGGKATTVFIED